MRASRLIAALCVIALVAVVVFAVVRGAFSFIQTYMAEKTSQGIAFDFRNEIFAKIQRLSFSYHDQNQTGQLMIRATDDVEKVRLFIAQGLILTAQAFLLLIATLIILFLTNWQLTLVIIPILPLALVIFMVFAVAGAIITRSAWRARSMCAMRPGVGSLKVSMWQGLPVRVSNSRALTKFCTASDRQTWTEWPCRINSRARSAAR